MQLNRKDILYLTIFNFLWVGSAGFCRLYEMNIFKNLENNYIKTIKTFSCVVILFSAYLYFTPYYSAVNEKLLIFLIVSLTITLSLSRFTFTIISISVKGNISNKLNVAVVGKNNTGERLVKYFAQHNHTYRLIKLDGNLSVPEDASNEDWYQGMTSCINRAGLLNINEIYFCLPPDKMVYAAALMAEAEAVYLRLSVVPDMLIDKSSELNVEFLQQFPVFSLQPHSIIYMKSRAQKRSFDIIFSFLVVVFLLSWLYPIIALIIKLQSRGPVLFSQKRSGRNNKTFYCYKFRSMRVNGESDKLQATRNDERITSIGRILRKTSLDELPQFFNVLKGEMSIVGPRPHMLEHTNQYQAVIDLFMIRHSIKPGITGLAQIHGLRGQITENAEMSERLEKDLEYIKDWTFMMDVRIIFITFFLSVRGQKNAF